MDDGSENKNVKGAKKCVIKRKLKFENYSSCLEATQPENNLSEGLHGIKCKLGHDDKQCDTCGIKCKYCNCFLEYTNFKDDLI